MPSDPQRDHPAGLGELESAGLEELRQRTSVRVLTRLLWMRKLFGPLLFSFALWVGLSDTAAWRRILMLVLASLLATAIIHDTIMTRRIRFGQRPAAASLVPNLVAVAIMQHIMIFATGGMASPVVPLILPVVFFTGIIGQRRLAWTVALAVHLPALWIHAGIQLGGLVELTPTALAGPGGASSQAPVTTILLALVMSLATTITTAHSTLAADGLTRTVGEALRARDLALATRNQQTRELTTLSGEIAHELKNPLASVKGLAQLIGRDLDRQEPPDKSAERMHVLRREVDRMQSILDEFLNFSRPLVPLNLREVELRELVDHVVDLHEGFAGERKVELRSRGRARAVCDPRKVEQILINLVQNAIEAAPSGSTVELEIADARPEQVRVQVRDHGPGLTESVRARVFEPGVTDKPEGSGLGLTIARALARQHGGELVLDDRAGHDDHHGKRGCEATLVLDARGVENMS